MGAVSMKMSRSTSTTSTSGMMLISAREELVRSPLPVPSGLNILGGTRHPGRRTAQEIEKVEDEPVHLGGPVAHAVQVVVVADHGGDGCAQAGCGRDERLGDSRCDHRQAGRSLLADSMEGCDDSPD